MNTTSTCQKGEHNLHLPDLHEEVRRVKAHFLHPNYTWNDKVAILASPFGNERHCLFKEFDIGLIRLNSALRLSDYVQVENF